MKNLALTILTGLFPFIISAQTGSVKGQLTDSTKQQLSSATVAVLQQKDSALVSYTLTDEKGAFEIKNIPIGTFDLYISYTGYEIFKKTFAISADQRVINMDTIILKQEFKTLETVVVTESPVKMHGDTISFKASAFNKKPDATVEEVLKKIPGIQVQKDGTIKAMGEQVQKVYVDGKEFFGNDPKVATKNLTADMVDQIQVFDDMSEQSRFTKIDDGSRSKSINIKLKKDKRKGDFGRVTAGVGTNSRYEGNFSLNHFRGDQRISLVGSANNTNKLSYTFNDYSSSQGSSQFSNGGAAGGGMINAAGATQGGISRPFSTGINFNDTWGPRLDFRGSYFYSDNSNLLTQNKFRRNSFPGDSTSEISTYNTILNKNRSHRVSMRFEYLIDSVNSLLYTANLGKQDHGGEAFDTSMTVANGLHKYLAVKSMTQKSDDRNGFNYSGELLYRRKFGKPGRTLTVGWRNNIGNNELESRNRAPVTTFNSNGAIESVIDINQHALQDNETGGNSISTSYTEPLGKNKLIEMNYAYSTSNNTADKRTYDFNSGSGKYDVLNEQLTNYFDYKNKSNRFGINFRHVFKKINYQLGMGMQFSDLSNRSVTPANGKDSTVRQKFRNLFPTANISYAITKSKSIRVFYRGRTNAPSVAQLQNVADNSNPLMIKTGNPELKQEFIHNLNLNYNAFQFTSQRFFSASMNLTLTGNKIVNSLDSSGPVTLIYKPENLNGSFNTSTMVSLNFPINKYKGLNVNLTNMMYLSRDANLVFRKKNFTTIYQLNQSAGINYGKEKFDVSLSTALIYNTVSYELDGGTNTNYLNHAYSADLTYRFKNRIFLLTDVDYYISAGRTAGYNQNVFLWNMSLAKKFFQVNTIEMKFTVYDILKQNNGVNRVIGENYFEDIRANVVPRFFLLSISYNLNRFGGNREQKTTPAPPMMIFK